MVDGWAVSALIVCLWIYAGVCAGAWLLSELTREYSWVDRIWSIVPVGYVAVFAGTAGFRDPRLDVLLVLVALWGARLTFNFARKGGYARGGEDYRWAVLRGRMSRWQFRLFNLFFITLYQNAVLLLICLPALTALEHRRAFGWADACIAVLFAGFLVGETVADQQQWDFHRFKRAEVAAGREPDPRFLSTGLFRYSRHPNFFFEQAQWWAVFAFGAVAAGSPWQPTVLGAVLLTLLFVGSTRFTESITVSRYPEYARYQASTSAVVPWLPNRRPQTQTS
jgi:steroid 5-alpha reductase family enzyme